MLETILSAKLPISGWPVIIIIITTQFISSYLVNLISYMKLKAVYPLFKTRKFEKKGQIYEKYLKIKLWKDYVPAIGSFDKKNLTRDKINDDYVSMYLLESLRAELCHFYAILFAIVVLFCTVREEWFFIIIYTILLNMPCIVIQRYNRPRFERMLSSARKTGHPVITDFYLKEEYKAPKKEKANQKSKKKVN